MAQLGTRLLTLTLGGEDYTAEVSNCRITSNPSDSDFTTFADAASGGAREYRLEFTAAQDPEVGSLWDKVFTSPGTTVAGIVMPAGGTTASASTPHFTFNATISEPDGDFLGGEANASTSARFTFECSWALTAKPARVIA